MAKKKRRKLRRWQKILLGVIIAVVIVLLAGVSIFYILKSRGESNLKTKEHYILYDGKKYRYREEVINILCIGVDKDEAMEEKVERRESIGMADAIFVASINTEEDEVKILAIPRDTVTELEAATKDGEPLGKMETQICWQYAFGGYPERSNKLMVDAVSHLLYNTPIQRCCAINYEALPIVNDAVGGVDVVVQEDIEELEPELKYGEEIHLEGRLALRFVEVRNKTTADGAFKRVQRQKQYISAFLKKAKSAVAENPSIPVQVFQQLQESGYIYTDITVEDLAYLVPELLEVSVSEDMIQVLPGESSLVEMEGKADTYHVEFHVEKDELKDLVISIFYEEVR